ncbi:MAG TPA: carbohydrate-binding protein [Phycisphaerales bacterium]|nr:carbohydrate-binding protein [Phycisphaerales bacterium]
MKQLLLLPLIVMCMSAVVRADGFGRQTTGGAGGQVITIDGSQTNAAALFKSYVETAGTPYIVQVKGTINLESVGGKVSLRANKTLRGIDSSPTIIGQIGFKNGVSNVIIERLNITNPYDWGEGDGVSIKEKITDVIVTRCTFYDCTDGLLDITRESDNVTVSWCRFYFTGPGYNNNRVSLIGASDSHTSDYGKLRVTFHHNWFGALCWQRIPSVRFGKVHLYNNFYDCPGNLYGVRSRIKAECLIENNYFRQINDPYYVYIAGEPPADYGKISASDNLFEDCTGQIDPGTDTVFMPPYDYNLDPTRTVPVIVQYGAGADGKEGYPPHWLFGLYGDFDLNGLVDEADLLTLVWYWLTEDDIFDADYNDDGVINYIEFALFADNWYRMPSDLTPPEAPQNVWALGQNGQVRLNWTANEEPDLAGYWVYRTTASGTDYQRLNASPLALPGYTDTDVVNGTFYYYVVRATDMNGNESGPSSEGCAQPAAGAAGLILQENATGFCGVDGIVDLGKHPGFTGAGFSDTTNAAGNGIDWKVRITEDGSYMFRWRYANASGDRPAKLIINDSVIVPSISFPGTGAWDNWNEISVGFLLSSGVKEVRLEAVGGEGLANIDYLRISGPAIEAVACD